MEDSSTQNKPNEKLISEIRELAKCNSDATDIIRAIVRVYPSESHGRSFMIILHIRKAFSLELSIILPVLGWKELGLGQLSDKEVNDILSPSIKSYTPKV